METRGTIAQECPQEEAGPQAGLVRLKLQTEAGRWVNVGPFGSLTGARSLAEDLLADHAVHAVRVEHRNKGTWRPAWSWLGAACGLVLAAMLSGGCGEPVFIHPTTGQPCDTMHALLYSTCQTRTENSR